MWHIANSNPRSREGSDREDQREVIEISISIHAPARGATIFTIPIPLATKNFNPRSREGSDFRSGAQRVLWAISIHAPARGATIKSGFHLTKLLFQSTLPRGERLYLISLPLSSISDFNPRSREGSDMWEPETPEPDTYFNPRSREGSDSIR